MEFILLEFPLPSILNFDKKPHPERVPVEHLEKTIQQKAKEAKSEILSLFLKLKFSPDDFQLIKDGEYQGGVYSKVWAKMYNDRTTQRPQTNFRKIFMRDGQIKKGKKMQIEEILGTTFKGLAFCMQSFSSFPECCQQINSPCCGRCWCFGNI